MRTTYILAKVRQRDISLQKISTIYKTQWNKLHDLGKQKFVETRKVPDPKLTTKPSRNDSAIDEMRNKYRKFYSKRGMYA